MSNGLKQSTVLVTGGAGFIGSALTRKLEDLGCHVIILDNLVAGKREHLTSTRSELIVGDINNKELLRYILKKNDIKYCFHLAAEPFIPKGYQDPEIMFHTNTLGSITVLMECHKAGVKRILQYSTSETYGTAQTLPMGENHPLNPHSIYALAKLAADRASFILWKERQVPVVILRQFNCFGPREAQPYIIPEIISQLTHDSSHILHLGNINAKRDFTWVFDACDGAINLMEASGLEGRAINLGRGKNWSIREIAEAIAKEMGIKNWGIDIDQNRLRPYDVDELLCDNTLYESLVGPLNFKSFEDGLRETIEWYNRHGQKWSWEK